MTLSVIIPALNEARRIPGLAAGLARQNTAHEVILVDGGSDDETVQLARNAGYKTLTTSAGRGRQLRVGAEAANGDILLFLHADSQLPDGALAAIENALRTHPAAPGGNFKLVFDGDDDFSRWLNGFYAWIRARGFYYGDSGVFVRRQVYDHIGGIRPIALMEDYDFNRRMERYGETVCIEDPVLTSSSRRFRNRRPGAIVMGWIIIHGLFHLGVAPDRLARWYNSKRA